MNPSTSVKRAPATNGKLRLFALSADFPASVRARWVTSTISGLAGLHWQTLSEIWKIDSLKKSERIRHMMTNNAANADVIVIAISSLTQTDPALIQWLDTLAALKIVHPAASLLIGLLGNETTKTGELDKTVKPLINCARQMGRDFIWHSMIECALNDSDWLTENIEGLLTRKAHVSTRYSS
jgi:hypothetical protein